MKRLLFVLTFMSLTFPVIWGQTKIILVQGLTEMVIETRGTN